MGIFFLQIKCFVMFEKLNLINDSTARNIILKMFTLQITCYFHLHIHMYGVCEQYERDI